MQKSVRMAQQAIAQTNETLKTTYRCQQGLSTSSDVLKAEGLHNAGCDAA
jgi:outer membrane protein TolC